MAFQTTVFLQNGSGVPGEQYANYPSIAQSFIMYNAGHPEYNIIGSTCYTITSPGQAQAGSGGALGFAGFLMNPKVYAFQGTAAGTLVPTLTLPNYTQGEFMQEGSLWVTLPGTAVIGDLIIFDNTTGAISSITNATALPSGHSFAQAQVDYYNVTTPGLAVITIQKQLLGTAVP